MLQRGCKMSNHIFRHYLSADAVTILWIIVMSKLCTSTDRKCADSGMLSMSEENSGASCASSNYCQVLYRVSHRETYGIVLFFSLCSFVSLLVHFYCQVDVCV